MKRIAVLLAEGFEEIEALTIVDILRRANLEVDLVAISDVLATTGAHGMVVTADLLLATMQIDNYKMVILPGGMPGSKNLAEAPTVQTLLRRFIAGDDTWVGAICAAPIALAAAGISKDYEGTCYPGCEAMVAYKHHHNKQVYVDRNLITSQGPATALPFALQIVETLCGKETSDGLAKDLLWK